VADLFNFEHFLSSPATRMDTTDLGGRMGSRVLIVDDSSMSRRIVRGFLENAGHQVTEAADGMAALERYSVDKPDLVLLDMVMSGMYGIQVLQKLREIDAQAKVIVTTADIQTSTRTLAEEAGSRGFVTKPIKRDELLGLVTSVLAEPPK
jgi:two-component system chemotaxis response regulator CheY